MFFFLAVSNDKRKMIDAKAVWTEMIFFFSIAAASRQEKKIKTMYLARTIKCLLCYHIIDRLL